MASFNNDDMNAGDSVEDHHGSRGLEQQQKSAVSMMSGSEGLSHFDNNTAPFLAFILLGKCLSNENLYVVFFSS